MLYVDSGGLILVGLTILSQDLCIAEGWEGGRVINVLGKYKNIIFINFISYLSFVICKKKMCIGKSFYQ